MPRCYGISQNQGEEVNVIRKWKKLLAIGCNHGHLADETALKAVLSFKEKWKPDTTIHLGDCIDLAALRTGAKGTTDESVNISDDFKAGTSYLRELRPNYFFIGNHEDRLYKLQIHPNAIISHCAGNVIGDLNDICKKLRCQIIPYDIDAGWRKFGDCDFGHGYMFNMQAIRDHAEMRGKCVIAHLHRVGQEPGRRSDHPVGYCVGTLANINRMTYAKTQRSRTAWSQGFAWGEYCDNEAVIRLERRCNSGEWRIPL